MILRPVRPGVAHGAADDEATGGVHVDVGVQVLEALELEHRLDHVLDDVGTHQSLDVDSFGVLGRDQDLLDRDRLAVDVADRDLGLAVGAQVVQHTGLADGGEPLGEPMREVDRHRHEVRRLVAGIAEHHALVAGADEIEGVGCLAVLHFEALVYALGDVGALLVDGAHDAAGLVVETELRPRVADVPDDIAHDALDIDVSLGADLPSHDDQSRRDERLARDAHVFDAAATFGLEFDLARKDGVDDRASEIWSHILSGWPSVTDSEVNRYSRSATTTSFVRPATSGGRLSVAGT